MTEPFAEGNAVLLLVAALPRCVTNSPLHHLARGTCHGCGDRSVVKERRADRLGPAGRTCAGSVIIAHTRLSIIHALRGFTAADDIRATPSGYLVVHWFPVYAPWEGCCVGESVSCPRPGGPL